MEKIVVELEAKTGKTEANLNDVVDAINNIAKSNKEATESQEVSQNKLLKSSKKLSKGFKGLGLALKATGFGVVMKIVDALSDALMRNQEIADVVNTVFTAIGIVFKQISDVMLDVFKNVSDATGGFDALQKVIGGALSIAINIAVGAIQGMMLGVKKAQLAWEESFLGDKNPETIKRLQSEIEEVGNKLDETGGRIKKAGSDIAENFAEAVGEVGELATGVAEGVSDAIEKIDVKSAISNAKRVVQNKKNYGLLEAQSRRLIEQYDLEAETQRQIRDDDRKSIQERIKANDELGKVLNKQAEEEKNAIQTRINALENQVALEGESVELTNELYDLNTELLAIDAKVAGFKSEQLVNEAALQKENIELTKAQQESENKLSIERKRFNAEQIEDEVLKLERLKEIDEEERVLESARLQAIVDNANAGTQAKIDAQIALAEFEEQSRQQTIEREKELSDALNKQVEENNKNEKKWADLTAKDKKEIALDGLNTLTNVLGKQSALGKAAAIANATISTYESATSAYKSLAPIPIVGPVLGGIAAGAAVVSGIANVKKISSTQVPGGGGGGGATPSAPQIPTSPSTPPSFNVVGQSSTNQLANAIGGQSQQPVQAYVVANDVSTAQSLDRNIVEGASI